MIDLSQPVTKIAGIGPAIGKRLEKLEIITIFDLLYHLPFRYEDRSQISSISKLRVGESATIFGTIESIKNEYTKKGKNFQSAIISDDTGSIPAIWFNQTYLTRTLHIGQNISLFGKIEFFGPKKTLVSPDYEIGNSSIHMGRIIPIYPETAGLSSKYLRTKIYQILPQLPQDIYPSDLTNWNKTIHEIHFPTKLPINQYKKRLAFDEIFLLQLTTLSYRQFWLKTNVTHPLTIDQEKLNQFVSSLPFTLTPSQNQTVQEILSDLGLSKPMNRLLEGDVGSGKTVIAAIAAYCAWLNGYQTLILAPTQILAAQHNKTLSAFFKPFGIDDKHIIVGTHALLYKTYTNVGLVIIDEQHRFGVAQRALLASKGRSPHILTMTATPIPRTIALTLYGDLDLSILNPLADRLKIKTWIVPEEKRQNAYQWIKNQKTQTFIVCPFIDESETMASTKAATSEYERLKKIFPDSKLGLLHGKLKSKEKDDVLNKFKIGELDILVSTPVVEVGIDIPKATIMVIEAAERFGLAQLHQLRGRVGRSNKQSYCLLFSNSNTSRLKSMETHYSGLELAEIDLKLRGPGKIFGLSQHGRSQLKIATYEDLDLINSAKKTAEKILPDIKDYPLLLDLLKQDKIATIQPN